MSLFRFPFGDFHRNASPRVLRRRHHAQRLQESSQLSLERFEPRAMLAADILEVKTGLPTGSIYGIGQALTFEVQYSEPVSVTSNPVAFLNFNNANGTRAQATFIGVSNNGKALTFSYTVLPGDSATNVDVVLGNIPTPGFLNGGVIATASDGTSADRAINAGEPTLGRFGLSVSGAAANPTVSPTYVNPTAWKSGAWATMHSDYFVIRGTIGDSRSLISTALVKEVFRVTINGATYEPTVASNGQWSLRIRSIGGVGADVPVLGALEPWSTTDTDAYNVIATLTAYDAVTGAVISTVTDKTTGELTIDTSSPTITAVGTNTPPKAVFGYAYNAGETIDIYVAYNEPIRYVAPVGSPAPQLQVNVAPAPAYADFVGIQNGNEVHFQYRVKPGDSASAFNIFSATPIVLGGGFFEDIAGNAAPVTGLPLAPAAAPAPSNKMPVITIDTVAPTVTAITSSSGNGTYVAADPANGMLGSPDITITVTFDKAVYVSGTPTLSLTSGGTAYYNGGSGTKTLSFKYTVLAGEDSADLNYTSTTPFSGGVIKDAAGNTANLTLTGTLDPNGTASLAANKAIVVAAKPRVVEVGVDSTAYPTGTYTAGDTIKILVTFDKIVTVNQALLPGLRLNTQPTRIATWSGYADPATKADAGAVNATRMSVFTYVVQPNDTTNGLPLNYTLTTDLSAGSGMNFVWTGIATPNKLAADLTLPTLLTTANKLYYDGIVIAPDVTAPVAPALALPTDSTQDNGNGAADAVTNVATVNVTGLETKQGGTWKYRTNGGAWSAAIPSTTTSFTLLANATYTTVEVQQFDSSGNTSPIGTASGLPWTLDTIKPQAPVSATILETGVAGSGVTNNPIVTVTGLESNALLQYFAGYNGTAASMPTSAGVNAGDPKVSWINVNPSGTNTFNLGAGIYDPAKGTGILVRQQDLAGNYSQPTQLKTSAGGTVVTVIIDLTVATPTGTLATDTAPPSPNNGPAFASDRYTNVGTVNVGGLEVQNLTATPPTAGLAYWEYSTDGGITVLTGVGSSFTLVDAPPPAPGGSVYAANTIWIRQKDLAGNLSAWWKNPTAWTIDQTAPSIQGITANGAGPWTVGQTVQITVNFGEAIYLSSTTNTPTLTLNTGATATLTGFAQGASTLKFNYLVRPGDSTPNLQVTAFTLPTGVTLADKAGNLAVDPLITTPYTLPGPVIVDAVIKAIAPQLLGSTTSAGPAVNTALTSIQIQFNMPVSGFGLSSVRLFWDPNGGTPTRVMSLAGASIRQINSTTYTLTLPKAATSAKGTYLLTIGGAFGGDKIRATANQATTMTKVSNIFFRRV